MKKKFFSLVFFLISLFSFGIVRASFLPLLGKVIYIDPGHGGKDPGAMYGKLKESDLNLQISLKLEEELEKQGAIVYLTRYGDYDLSSNNAELRKRSDLSRRANVINNSNADLYLSIHLNSDASSIWSGAQVFYVDTNEKNKYIAQLFQEELKKDLKTDREYKKIYNQYLYERVKIPGVLVEAGFISNVNERYLLKQDNYQLKIAQTLTKSIINYFNIN